MGAAHRESDLTGGIGPHLPRIPRRRFLGYLIAGPTLVAGAQLGLGFTVANSRRDRIDIVNHRAERRSDALSEL